MNGWVDEWMVVIYQVSLVYLRTQALIKTVWFKSPVKPYHVFLSKSLNLIGLGMTHTEGGSSTPTSQGGCGEHIPQ